MFHCGLNATLELLHQSLLSKAPVFSVCLCYITHLTIMNGINGLNGTKCRVLKLYTEKVIELIVRTMKRDLRDLPNSHLL